MKPQTLTLKVTGMHCVSCAMNIDGELEDLPGVIESTTSYPKSQTKVTFDPDKVAQEKLSSTIRSLGYEISDII